MVDILDIDCESDDEEEKDKNTENIKSNMSNQDKNK